MKIIIVKSICRCYSDSDLISKYEIELKDTLSFFPLIDNLYREAMQFLITRIDLVVKCL